MKKHIPLLILTLFPLLLVGQTCVSGDCVNGQGIYTYSNGAKYIGEYKNGLENGQGTYNYADGDKYVGEYKNGLANGQGTYNYADGRKYVGEFKLNQYHGQGTFTYPDGGSYVGEFKVNQYHGQGTYTYSNGAKYIGEYKYGRRHGLGTVNNVDGSKYVGEFNNGAINGKGVFFKVSGETESGIFNYDNFQTPWTIEAVSRFLKNKYPQFTGFDYQAPNPVVTKPRYSVPTPKPTPVVVTTTPKPTPGVGTVKSSGASISGFIAVLEFEGNNISSGEVRALTDRLRTELVGTGELTIIERGKMEEVLKEQSFQQTGCISSECAVEVGKLLGVEQIVSGNISKVGNYFSVTARVVSVTTGEIVRSTIYDYSGDIGGLLTQGMRKVAEELGK